MPWISREELQSLEHEAFVLDGVRCRLETAEKENTSFRYALELLATDWQKESYQQHSVFRESTFDSLEFAGDIIAEDNAKKPKAEAKERKFRLYGDKK